MHEDGSFHTPRTSIVALENTHNNAGGTVWPLDELRAVVATARELGLKLHLDGARLMNAAVALAGSGGADRRSLFDTVTLCLSKGLGCPLGALIAGSARADAPRADGEAPLRRRDAPGRHRRGGGLYALDHNVERLAEDHARARRLAEGWAEPGLPVDLERVQTNFVQLDVGALGLGEWEAVGRVRDAGVALSRTMRPGFLRAVTHLDLTDDDIDRAVELVPAGARSACPRLTPARSTGCSQERQADRLPSVAGGGRAQGRACLVERRRRRRLRRGPRRDAGYAVPHRLDHEDVHRDGDHAAPRRRSARSRRPPRTARRRDRERHADDPSHALRTSRDCSARRGRCSSTGESPTEDELVASMSEVEFVLGPRAGASLLEPRVRAARPGRRAQERPAVHAVRRRADHRAARPDAHDVDAAGAEGAGLPRRRVRAHRVDRAGDRPRRRRRRRGSSGRRSRTSAAGRRSSRGGADGVLAADDDRGDVVPAGHVLPATTGCSAGGSG